MINNLARAMIALTFLAMVPTVWAQAQKAGAKGNMIAGILMDKNCSNKAVQDKDPYANASKHTKRCATMGACASSGYGVVTSEGKFLKFDAKGDEQAKALLEKSQKKDNLTVTVEGTLKGDVLEVKSIKEQSAE